METFCVKLQQSNPRYDLWPEREHENNSKWEWNPHLLRWQSNPSLSDHFLIIFQVIENLTNLQSDNGLFEYIHRSPGLPHDIYDLMMECWRRDDIDRPTFYEIHGFLQRKGIGYSWQGGRARECMCERLWEWVRVLSCGVVWPCIGFLWGFFVIICFFFWGNWIWQLLFNGYLKELSCIFRFLRKYWIIIIVTEYQTINYTHNYIITRLYIIYLNIYFTNTLFSIHELDLSYKISSTLGFWLKEWFYLKISTY